MSASINEHHGHPQDCSFRLSQDSSLQGGESFFRNILATMETVYLNRNPTAKAILELVRSVDDDRLCYDHFAFRTYGRRVEIPCEEVESVLVCPPNVPHSDAGAGVNGPLPRIFISELLVDQMSPEAQKIIRKYTNLSGNGNMHAALASALGCLTWEKPSYSEFQQLARESEYAAWTLVNGYTLNHVTISAHRLKSHLRNIRNLNQFIEENGFKLNSEGGILKGSENMVKTKDGVSPDGLLLQSSTVADSTSFQFAEGIVESIPCSYIEFAERLVLPQFKNLPENEVEEIHRRDGFEVGNADKIFESTSMDQLTRKVA
ncbi:hypothetical protein DH2020_003406 [Rehmannia glutinosa]|uniref:2-oxoadipate dioxygenase/decarboxylase n=1 Tax=Rehmannia glutinosa TaxID=99300 RepID=A0ABR0XLP9_REHGL